MNEDLNQKEKIYFKICHTVLKFEVKKGHLRWSISEVSRSCGITRSLIYYYFGKEKLDILLESVRFMSDVMFGKSAQKSQGVSVRIRSVLDKLQQMPYLLHFFLQHKNSNSECGKIIRQAEMWLLDLLKNEYPTLNENQVLKIYLLELGLMLHGRCSDQQIEYFFPLNGPLGV